MENKKNNKLIFAIFGIVVAILIAIIVILVIVLNKKSKTTVKESNVKTDNVAIIDNNNNKNENSQNLNSNDTNATTDNVTADNKISKNPIATIDVKNYGTIKVELYPDIAPNTVNNFITLANNGLPVPILCIGISSFYTSLEDLIIENTPDANILVPYICTT